MKHLALSMLPAAALLLVSPQSQAKPNWFACLKDGKRLCKGVQGGGGRVLECLSRHYGRLSADCKPMVAPVKGTILSWRDACGSDIDKHCSTLPAGPVILRCLSKHRRTLAPHCRAKMKQAARDFAFACVNDTRTHCSGVEAGGGRVLACLASKQRRVTPGCRKVVGLTKPWVDAWRGACGADIDKLCRHTAPGWHAMGCLGKHHQQVSPPCKAHLQKAAQNFVAICAADLKKHCTGIEPGGGRLLICLEQHRTRLRPACTAAIP